MLEDWGHEQIDNRPGAASQCPPDNRTALASLDDVDIQNKEANHHSIDAQEAEVCWIELDAQWQQARQNGSVTHRNVARHLF